MTDLEQLIETAERLSQRLARMAEDERRFGWELSMQLENISYDVFCNANAIKEIESKLVGGVA